MCCSQGIANKAWAAQTLAVLQARYVCRFGPPLWHLLQWVTVKVFQYLKVICSSVCSLTFRYSNFLSELRFPSDYPTGCLLGCVNVTDCLSQEQFRQQVGDTRYTIHTLNSGKEREILCCSLHLLLSTNPNDSGGFCHFVLSVRL